MKYLCLILSLFLLLLTVGCGSDKESSDESTAETTSADTTLDITNEDNFWGDDTGYRTLGDHELDIDFD